MLETAIVGLGIVAGIVLLMPGMADGFRAGNLPEPQPRE